MNQPSRYPENDLPAIVTTLQKASRVVIITHVRPDGDAIGSQLGLGLALRELGKDVLMINSDPMPGNLEWMALGFDIEVYTGSIAQRSKIDQADCIVIVDVNQLKRLGPVASAVELSSARKIIVDHHLGPEDWFDLRYIRFEATSAGELVFDLLELLGLDLVNEDIATALYTAIMTDTGSFRFDTVTARTHRIIAELLERGNIRPDKIHVEVFDQKSKEGLDLYALVLETLELSYGGRVGSLVLAQSMLHDTGAHSEESEGFVNSILSIRGVEIAVMFLELERGVKLSFRSKGRIPVNRWAVHFGGGGHANAAGAFVSGALDDVISAVLEAVPRCVPQLDELIQANN